MADSRCALGIDLGGTKIAVAAVNEAGEKLAESRVPTRSDDGPEAVVDRILSVVEEVRTALDDHASPIGTIGVGVPGQLDRERRTVLSAPNLVGWTDIPLAVLLEERLDRNVRLENDANLAALAEHAAGAGQGVDDLILLTLGTGVGGGLIQGGAIWKGANGWAGELGHVMLDPDGPPCGMGHSGCLESLASGTAIARTARERLDAGGAVRLRELVDGDPERVTAELVGRAALDGDEACRAVFREAGRALGRGIASLVLVFDPAIVVLGGSVAQVGDIMLEPARETARAALFPASADLLRIETGRLGVDSGVLGAAFLAMRDAE